MQQAQKAQKTGAAMRLPCCNRSNVTTTIYGQDIYLGFIHIQNLEQKVAHTIEAEWEQNGAYTNFEDFVTRTYITLEQLLILIRVQALRFIGQDKKALLWEAHTLLGIKVTPVIRATFFIFLFCMKLMQIYKQARDKNSNFFCFGARI